MRSHHFEGRDGRVRVAALFTVLASLAPAAIAATPAGQIAGVQIVGERGVTESVEQIMARERIDAPMRALKPPRVKREVEVERDRLPQNPLSAKVPRFPSAELLDRSTDFRDPRPYTPQTVGLSFNGVTGPGETGAFPPDTDGAVGPTQYVVAVNGRFRTFDKATGLADGALDVDSDVFFASVMTAGANFTSDPHVRYDRLSGRWIIDMIDVPGIQPGAKPNRIMIAVSSGSTIASSGSFTFFQFTGDGTNFDDYPTLGIDPNALYIGTNAFKTTTGLFARTNGFVVRKSSILGAGPIVVTKFLGLVATSSSAGPYTPQGVDNYDPAATEGYFIGVDNLSFGLLKIRRVSTPGGTPTISSDLSVTVPTTALPIDVPHQGSTTTLDPLDDRLFAAHLRNGQLWTAHNINVNQSGVGANNGTRDGTRWYAIGNLSGTPTLIQSGTVFDSAASNPKFYWIPSIMVSGQGHAALGFSTAGTTYRANAGTVGRLAGDAFGTMQTPVDYTASSTAYNPTQDTGNPRRWGDYSYTSLDPSDDMTMWTIQEFCVSTNNYGTQVVRLNAPPPATPASASPSTVSAGQSSVIVTITGTSVAGSGFYDTPSTGIVPAPNHITASVTGGVTVNSVTFVDATHVTLDLNTSAASAGTQDVQITNPDGQSVTGEGVLTVAGQSADVSLTKTDAPDPVIAGNTVTYTLTLNNAGPAAAQSVSVADPLPAATTFVSVTVPAGWSATAPAVGANGTVTLSNPSVAANTSAILKIVVRVKSNTASGTLVINSATASSSTSDPTPGNNSASSTTTVTTSADLALTNADAPDPVSPGQNLTYTLTLNQKGPSEAKSVAVSDPLPSGETFVSAAAPIGWTASAPAVGANGTVTFSKATLGRNTVASFTIVAKADPGPGVTTLSNTATASSTTSDPVSTNNSATANTAVGNSVDLSVTDADAPDPVNAGANITYTVTATNNSAAAASNVSMSQPLASNTTFVSDSGAPGWSCSDPAVGASGTITCTIASLAGGASGTFTIVARVLPGVVQGAVINSTATVSGSAPDPNSANNSATASTSVNHVADMQVTVTDSPDPVHAGQNLTYKVKVLNAGPGNAASVAMGFGLPPNTTFVSNAGVTGWTCTNPAVGANGVVTCSKSSMGTGGNATFSIVVNVDPGLGNNSMIGASPTVSTTTTDPVPGNNGASTTTTVVNP